MRVPVSRTFVLSVAGVTVAALLCAVALARALTVDPVEPSSLAPMGVASIAEIAAADGPAARVPSEGVLEMESLALAVDHDPFMPDRSRAASYRLPGEFVERPVVEREPEPDPPPFRVVGTAQVGGAGIALVQVENSTAPEIVKVGESLFGYRLQRVETEAATLVGQGQSFRLAVERGEVAGGERDERRGGRNERNNRNAEEQVAERLRGVLEQLQERGLPAQMIEQLMRQQMGRGGRNIEIERTDVPGRVIVRTRPDTLSFEPPHTPEPR
jgi:hypothetical protein